MLFRYTCDEIATLCFRSTAEHETVRDL
jgi:hypothetical protein